MSDVEAHVRELARQVVRASLAAPSRSQVRDDGSRRRLAATGALTSALHALELVSDLGNRLCDVPQSASRLLWLGLSNRGHSAQARLDVLGVEWHGAEHTTCRGEGP